MVGKCRTGLCFKSGPRAIENNISAVSGHVLGLAEVDPALIRHLQKQKIRELLNVIAIINSVMAQGMAKPPEFSNNVAHIAIA
jgi:hypothetical protein